MQLEELRLISTEIDLLLLVFSSEKASQFVLQMTALPQQRSAQSGLKR